MTQPRVLVTGAFGTVGPWTLDALLATGADVTVFELDTPRGRTLAKRYAGRVRVVWGDLRDAEAVAAVVPGHDVVAHMAFILTPTTEERPEFAEAINLGGTRHVIAACQQASPQPRLLFSSSVEVFGKNRHLPGPRSAADPVQVTSVYTGHKVACEQLVRDSGLDWLIVRFGAVIDIALGNSHPLMFEFPLDVRFEVVHPADAARAVAHAVTRDAPWGDGKTLLIGGGPTCQTTYGDFLNRMLTALGVGALPAEAFTQEDYPSDWMDTTESEALLGFQQHSLDDILTQVAAKMGWRSWLMPVVRPLARRSILKLSPYWQRHNQR